MKKVDFRKIQVQDIEGKNVTVDISKELGNSIYKNTPDLGELDFAQSIYKDGEVEIDKTQAEIIRKYLDAGGFLAFVKKSVFEILDTIINAK